jgi:prepilin-type N-terminal cleavage/methylation domain-containing protein
MKKTNGFSLAEILVCMMLIGLIVVAILPSITFGYFQLSESGKRTRAVYSVRQITENEMVNQSTPGTDSLNINFGGISIDVKGRILETEESFGVLDNKARIRVFIPHK